MSLYHSTNNVSRMVRCEEFYLKWNKAHNFCEKNPRTAGQIDAYLDEMEILTQIASKSKDPKYSEAIAQATIPEGALRSLIAVKDQKLHDEIAQQLVKLAVNKVAKKEKLTIGNKEVRQLVNQHVKPLPKTKPAIKPTPTPEQSSVLGDTPTQVDGATTKVSTTESQSAPTESSANFDVDKARVFMWATVDTLKEKGFDAEAIATFFITGMIRYYPKYRETYREEIVDKQIAPAEQEKIAAAEAKETLEIINAHEMQLRDLWKEGLNMDEIGKKLGYREIQIYNALKAMGLK